MFEIFHPYLSPKLEARTHHEKGGFGLYAGELIQAGELLVVWNGDLVSGKALSQLPATRQRYAIQIDEDLYMLASDPPHPADYINHACEPNAGLSHHATLVAITDIAPGAEICYDYAMSDSTPYDEFNCTCGSPLCRGRVTGNDWMRPELWERYTDYFSPYLQRRIERLKGKEGSTELKE